MRTTMTPLGATGAGPWVPIDTEQTAFGVGYIVSVQGGSTLTFKTQHGWSAPTDQGITPVSLTRSSTTATLTMPNPFSPKVGDSLVIAGAGAPFDGTFDIASVTNSTTVTYTVANSGATAAPAAGVIVSVIRTADDPVVTGKTATTEGNLAFPCSHLRLNLTAWSAGAAIMTLFQPSGN
jgi:hypothetical protein